MPGLDLSAFFGEPLDREAEARDLAFDEGRAGFRARCRTVLTSPQAEGRRRLAEHLALDCPKLSEAECLAILADALPCFREGA